MKLSRKLISVSSFTSASRNQVPTCLSCVIIFNATLQRHSIDFYDNRAPSLTKYQPSMLKFQPTLNSSINLTAAKRRKKRKRKKKELNNFCVSHSFMNHSSRGQRKISARASGITLFMNGKIIETLTPEI